MLWRVLLGCCLFGWPSGDSWVLSGAVCHDGSYQNWSMKMTMDQIFEWKEETYPRGKFSCLQKRDHVKRTFHLPTINFQGMFVYRGVALKDPYSIATFGLFKSMGVGRCFFFCVCFLAYFGEIVKDKSKLIWRDQNPCYLWLYLFGRKKNTTSEVIQVDIDRCRIDRLHVLNVLFVMTAKHLLDRTSSW